MRLVIQRVSRAAVRVDGETVGQIDSGLMILVGVGREDTQRTPATWPTRPRICGFFPMSQAI